MISYPVTNVMGNLTGTKKILLHLILFCLSDFGVSIPVIMVPDEVSLSSEPSKNGSEKIVPCFLEPPYSPGLKIEIAHNVGSFGTERRG
jgi:hypothetical protein